MEKTQRNKLNRKAYARLCCAVFGRRFFFFLAQIKIEKQNKTEKKKQSKEYVISWHSWNFIFFYNYVQFSKMSKKKMPVMIVHLQNKRGCL